MRSSRMGQGASSSGAPLPPVEISQAKAGGAVLSLALIESQYVVSYPPAASEWLARLAPHATALIIVMLIRPWIVLVLIRFWMAVRSVLACGVKAVMTYFVVKTDEIREERQRADREGAAPLGISAGTAGAIGRNAGNILHDGQKGDESGVGSGS